MSNLVYEVQIKNPIHCDAPSIFSINPYRSSAFSRNNYYAFCYGSLYEGELKEVGGVDYYCPVVPGINVINYEPECEELPDPFHYDRRGAKTFSYIRENLKDYDLTDILICPDGTARAQFYDWKRQVSLRSRGFSGLLFVETRYNGFSPKSHKFKIDVGEGASKGRNHTSIIETDATMSRYIIFTIPTLHDDEPATMCYEEFRP